MDLTTLIGIAAGIAALVGGFLWEGGEMHGLVEKTAILIVFGGTFAAVAVSFPASRLRGIPSALRLAFSKDEDSQQQIIERMTEMATIARRGGVLALETHAGKIDNRFLREGILMVVDGTDPDLTKEILELEIEALERSHEQQAKIFESAGGFAPTMGIIGTVMGLIKVLGDLHDPGSLGSSIAVAFTATLYGVASANVVYLPLASKIRSRSQEQVQRMEMMLEGIMGLQAGENPQLIRKKLQSFVVQDEPMRRKPKAAREGAEGKADENAAQV
ncbi:MULTISPECIES: flagellar motor protein [unclassified Paenibacillus]|uniref:flagellar motor protein n=1 Tax=unclassified Paenibacillus TaxID=185978 RepID=UPI000956AB32|nr:MULTISPECIES: flagellar motor protein [unclassified Paenibacillus]ASS68106.1 flagellar motor protein [Paenibacillus sp. RUD330]SIR68263.1 chemotaxis protein MotA [Paenibacillus sp. RU4X]SIR75863.1 chemotaxis protein MotA [Paenibacillus sp. RU4T]